MLYQRGKYSLGFSIIHNLHIIHFVFPFILYIYTYLWLNQISGRVTIRNRTSNLLVVKEEYEYYEFYWCSTSILICIFALLSMFPYVKTLKSTKVNCVFLNLNFMNKMDATEPHEQLLHRVARSDIFRLMENVFHNCLCFLSWTHFYWVFPTVVFVLMC